MNINYLIICFVAAVLLSCTGIIDDSDEDSGAFSDYFNKKASVFGIDVYARPDVTTANLIRSASIMAEYLDSDEDGVPNSQAVADSVANNGMLGIFVDADDADTIFAAAGSLLNGMQNLNQDEIVSPNGTDSQFDASLEEILHLVTQQGHSRVFSELAESPSSNLANAMDAARGGYFDSVPDPYPDDAWYSYDDETCDYTCQITEYFYWGITSYLGGQQFSGRLSQIDNEWKLNTTAKITASDNALEAILTNTTFKLPTALPNGIYDGFEITVESI
ncbi:MAG: hypothetical protein O3A01_01790 [bacterium]|nr:hypothetical protein [bacterium]